MRGRIERIDDALAGGLLPLGLADGVRLRRAVGRGQPIPRSAVDAPAGGRLAELRAEHEALAGRPTAV